MAVEAHHKVIMDEFGQKRPYPLSGFTLAGDAAVQSKLVLGPGEGVHLIHFRDQGSVFIKLGSHNGSEDLAIGTQQVMRGTGIPIHRHTHMDESFYILEGKGTVTLDDVTHTFERGATIHIPRNSWHGFQNPDDELLLLWVVTPAGLDGFFRETCSTPGAPPKALTREQINAIAMKYATEFR